MPGRVASPSMQLGQLLLRGYTMLAAACDDCQLPLMMDPETRQSHCVGCRRLFDSDGNLLDNPEVEIVSPSSAQHTSTPAASEQPQHSDSSAFSNSSSSPLSSPHVQPSDEGVIVADGPLVSSSGPQQLLAPQQQQSTEPQQQEATDSDDEREVAEIRHRLEQQRLHQAYEARQRQRAAAAAGSNANDPSQMLADRLLAGWTLLGQSCPICHTPLMRSRGGEVRCIVCDLPVVIEQQQPAQEQAAASNAPVAEVGLGQTPARTAAAAAAADAAQMLSLSPASQQQQKEEGTADAWRAVSDSRNHHVDGSDVCESQVLRHLQQVLLVKLQETTQQLDAMVTPQPTQMTGCVTTAEQLLTCLEKVKQIMSL